MENQQANPQAAVNELYNYAANLMVNEKRNTSEVQTALVGKGLSESAAFTIIHNLQVEIKNAKKRSGKKRYALRSALVHWWYCSYRCQHRLHLLGSNSIWWHSAYKRSC